MGLLPEDIEGFSPSRAGGACNEVLSNIGATTVGAKIRRTASLWHGRDGTARTTDRFRFLFRRDRDVDPFIRRKARARRVPCRLHRQRRLLASQLRDCALALDEWC